MTVIASSVSCAAKLRFGCTSYLLSLLISISCLAQTSQSLYQKRDPFPEKEFFIGIKAGAALYDLYFAPTRVGDYLLSNQGNASESYHGGLFARQEARRFFLQLEAVYSYQYDGVFFVNLDPDPKPLPHGLIFTAGSDSYEFHTVQMPLLGGYRPLSFLRIFVGPYVSATFPGKLYEYKGIWKDIYQISTDTGRSFRGHPLNAGYQIGIGADVWKFTVDVQYSRSLAPYSTHVTHQGTSYPFRSKVAQLSVMIGIKMLEF